MPRRAAAVRREVQPDAVYNNRLVTQLINKVLLDGKKSLAERIVYGAFDIVAEKTQQDALSVFKKAMDNVRPTLEVKPKRVGGATYQVPMEGNSRRATTPSVGSSTSPVSARSTPWLSVLLLKSWTPPRTLARLSRSAKTSTRWLNPTVHSRIIVGRE